MRRLILTGLVYVVHRLNMDENKQMAGISYLSSPSNQLVTVEDLHNLKKDILFSIKQIIDASNAKPIKKWLKSYEVEKLLDLSPNTLMSWRNNGTIPFTKIGGTIYYDPEDIEKELQRRKTVYST